LRKAQLLVIMVAATLVLSAALSLSFDNGSVQVGSSIVGNAARVVEDIPLPMLSESTAPSQTDNSTTPTSSSGVVKASFTVVTESRTPPTSSVARESSDASPSTAAQAVSSAVADDQPVPVDQLSAAADVHPKSGGLTAGRVLLVAAWSLEMALMCGLAFLHVRARKRALGHIATN
jgi:hypothetical protein